MNSSSNNQFQQNYNELFSLYENERNSIETSKKGKSLFYKNMDEYKQFILMGVILYNYNSKTISVKNTQQIIKQTVVRLEHIPKTMSWKIKLNILNDIATNFNDFILPYTGFNLIVEFHGEKQKEFINSKTVYDCISSTATAVFVMCISPSVYCVICLDNQEANELHECMNGLVLKGERYNFTLSSRYIQPVKQHIQQQYDWKTKTYTKIVNLPFNNILIPVDNIIKLNMEHRKNLAL